MERRKGEKEGRREGGNKEGRERDKDSADNRKSANSTPEIDSKKTENR